MWIDDDGELNPGVFREREFEGKQSMSTDWDKYSTPEISLKRAKNLEDNGIINFSDEINETLGNDIVKYYEKEGMVGTDITHLGKFDIAMGVTGFENVVVTAGFSF